MVFVIGWSLCKQYNMMLFVSADTLRSTEIEEIISEQHETKRSLPISLGLYIFFLHFFLQRTKGNRSFELFSTDLKKIVKKIIPKEKVSSQGDSF